MNLEVPIQGAPNFRLAELIKSATAAKFNIPNLPSAEQAQNLQLLACKVLQPVRDHFGVPIRVTSGFRSSALNAAIKGSPASFHSYGMAADIEFLHPEEGKLIDLFEYIYHSVPFTELISEELPNGWIHVAYAKGRENERQLKYKLAGAPLTVRATFDDIMTILEGRV